MPKIFENQTACVSSYLENIKDACKIYFNTELGCDVLAGERNPSFTDVRKIRN